MSTCKKLKIDSELAQDCPFEQRPPKDSKKSMVDILNPHYIEQQPNHILLFTVLNPTYPVTCNVLNIICSPIGKVLRIIIFKKNGVQAFVEFESNDTAKKAKENLHGSDIYSGCCTLRIQYAKPTKLKVYKNDSNTYDFTNPNLGKGLDMDSPNGSSASTTSQQRPNRAAYKIMDLRDKIPRVSKEEPIKDCTKVKQTNDFLYFPHTPKDIEHNRAVIQNFEAIETRKQLSKFNNDMEAIILTKDFKKIKQSEDEGYSSPKLSMCNLSTASRTLSHEPSRSLSTPKMPLPSAPELVPILGDLTTPNSSTNKILPGFQFIPYPINIEIPHDFVYFPKTITDVEHNRVLIQNLEDIETKTSLTKHNNGMEAIIAEYKINFKTVESKLEKIKNENEIVKKERDKLQQSHEKLEQEVQIKNKTIESFEKSNIEAKCDLEKLKHDKKVLKIVAESKNKTIESLKKSHSEAKREVEKLKHDEKILTEEVKSKTKKIKALEESEIGNKEESSAKFKKIKELLATKIFLANFSNENLVSLLNDDIEKLFDKYDQIGTNTKDSDKLKDITETLADVKVKLSLQTQKRELYDKQFNEIMDILNFSKEARCIGNVLPALKELKESHCELQDQIETGHYSKAQSVIETFLNIHNSVN